MTTITKIKLSISNCYLLQGDKNILVDSGNPGEGQKIIAALREKGLELRDISLILHTHGHADHCGSTQELLRVCEIPTAIHVADRFMSDQGTNGEIKTKGLTAFLVKPFINKPYPSFQTDISIEQETDLSAFGVEAKIYFTPGHTQGSISIVTDQNEAILGDLLMGGYMGGRFFSHIPDYHYFVNDLEQVNQSIKKMLNFRADTFFAGHGGPLKRKAIEAKFSNK
ncbi:MAG: MBL fold metallo-hydrolase [Bacteroidia bacterium]